MEGKRRQRIALYAWLLFGPLCLTGTVAAEPYPFNDSGHLGDARLMPQWRETLTRQQIESTTLQTCVADASLCRSTDKALRHLLIRTSTLAEHRKISLVNHYVNRKRYKADRSRRVTTDLSPEPVKYRSRWSTLTEFMQRGGDCEDFATSKYFLLREMGVPADRMRVVIAYESTLRGHHALLAIRMEPDVIWLLDTDDIIRRGTHHDYRFIYSLNESSIWDHEAVDAIAVSGITTPENSS